MKRKKHEYHAMVKIDDTVRFWVFQKLKDRGYVLRDHQMKQILFTYDAPITGNCFTTCEEFKLNSLKKSNSLVDCGNNIKLFLDITCVESGDSGVKMITNETKDVLLEYNLRNIDDDLPDGYRIATKEDIINFYLK